MWDMMSTQDNVMNLRLQGLGETLPLNPYILPYNQSIFPDNGGSI